MLSCPLIIIRCQDIHLMLDLRLDWNVDVLVPPDAGPGLRYRHLGRHHAVAVVAVRHGAGRRGGGGEGRGRRWQVIIAGVDVVDVIVLKYQIISLIIMSRSAQSTYIHERLLSEAGHAGSKVPGWRS